jgi:thymidylate synthase (FAD)
MEIVKPSAKIIYPSIETLKETAEKHIAYCARFAHMSQHKVLTKERQGKFLKTYLHDIPVPHRSIAEHVSVTVEFVLDRALTTELLRHRHSYTQESTRFVSYANGIKFLSVSGYKVTEEQEKAILELFEFVDKKYQELKRMGTPRDALRKILPLGTSVHFVMTANLTEWIHILKIRSRKDVDPVLRKQIIELFNQFHEAMPYIFPKEMINDACC